MLHDMRLPLASCHLFRIHCDLYQVVLFVYIPKIQYVHILNSDTKWLKCNMFIIFWNNQVSFLWIVLFTTAFYKSITRAWFLMRKRQSSLIRELTTMVSLWSSVLAKALWVFHHLWGEIFMLDFNLHSSGTAIYVFARCNWHRLFWNLVSDINKFRAELIALKHLFVYEGAWGVRNVCSFDAAWWDSSGHLSSWLCIRQVH